MVKIKIKLDKVDDLTVLNAAASDMPFDIDAASGWYVVDAKSLIGLFGLKLSKPIRVSIYTDRLHAQPFLDRIQTMMV
ncbi:MAG: HPr family phosphocarrier protein [Eubacteriales bacterium]|nr:HPr family phosphocarrier protein [Eubacteriales bacterium]